MVQIPAARVPRGARRFSRATASVRTARDIGEPCGGQRGAACASTGERLYAASRIDLHRALERGVVSHAGAARQSGMRRARSIRGSSTSTTRACTPRLSFDPAEDVAAPYIARGARPAVAVLREQGVNSQIGDGRGVHPRRLRRLRRAHDRHLARRARLARFHGLVACGGFSYGDVLGAGEGWAKSILFNPLARDEFARILRARRDLHPGRLQRLPDAVGAEGADPGRRRLAALRAQPLRAVRGAPVAGAGAALELGAARRHARLGAADRGGARRGLRGIREPVRAPASCSSRGRSDACNSSTTATSRPSAIPAIRTARRSGSPECAAPTAGSPRSCRIPSGCFARCRTPGRPRRGARTAAGCACSAMRAVFLG